MRSATAGNESKTDYYFSEFIDLHLIPLQHLFSEHSAF